MYCCHPLIARFTCLDFMDYFQQLINIRAYTLQYSLSRVLAIMKQRPICIVYACPALRIRPYDAVCRSSNRLRTGEATSHFSGTPRPHETRAGNVIALDIYDRTCFSLPVYPPYVMFRNISFQREVIRN